MKNTILVTDSLFVLPENVTRLTKEGFEVRRLDKVKATEEEIIDSLRGCRGYILGGIEQVTSNIISNADQLEAICFTGSGYSEFIPAHEEATQKGIAITSAKGANAVDVAEFTIGMLIEMARHFPLLRTRSDLKGNSFCQGRRLKGQLIGIVGYGAIGREVARLCGEFGMKVLIHSRHPVSGLPSGMEFVDKQTIIRECGIISIHTNKNHGTNVLDAKDIRLLKPGTIIINAAFPDAVDCKTLLDRIASKEVRAAFDALPPGDLANLHPDYLAYSNSQSAFNTQEAIKDTSDRCTLSIINLLKNGADKDVVNPAFAQFRRK
jgi:D-3-phosphoglycerate dehydrogenase